MIDKVRSPLKDKPLRTPGQSLEEKLRETFDDKILAPLIAAVMAFAFAATEWYRYFTDVPPHPVLFSLIALCTFVFVAWRSYKVIPELRRMRQGINGEKAVGQFLDMLREKGYRVYHDIIGQSFNLDHVLIGPAGIFTIETKTWSKPLKGDARVIFDGEKLSVGSMGLDRDPVVQVRSQASWIKELLMESTGQKFDVKPVILFPGWYVDHAKGASRQVWVLNPKAFVEFLANEPVRLGDDEIKLASYHLSRFIRVSERVA